MCAGTTAYERAIGVIMKGFGFGIVAAASAFVVVCGGADAVGHKPVPTYTINLDAAPEHRYDHIVGDLSNGFNATVWGFWNKYFANDKILTDVLFGISDKRGDEVPEMQAEIEGLAAASGLPLKFVKSIQMLYELQTLMIPIVNFTKKKTDAIPAGFEALARIPWRGPGCTGIIAKCADGTVYHARNLDFAPLDVMSKLVYVGIFTKGGKEVFRSQMVAGYTMVVTGARFGSNGYAIERNTRYTDHWGGNLQMLEQLFKGVPLNGWSLRKILEDTPDYDSAVSKIRSVEYASTEYAIVSGVKKGTIISRAPKSVVFTQTLGEHNFEERDDYIIMTNFDFFHGDIREWFDPTGHGGFGKPVRRVAAQKILNATSPLTQAVLFDAINAQYVIADTVFQAIINVEKSIWNVSQPILS